MTSKPLARAAAPSGSSCVANTSGSTASPSPQAVGGAWRTFERPDHFFSKDGLMPERATLELVPPPGFEGEEFHTLVAARLAEKEREAAAALAAEGRGFMGARRVLAQKHTSFPAPGEPRRGLDPRIAARDKVGPVREDQRTLRPRPSGAGACPIPRGTRPAAPARTLAAQGCMVTLGRGSLLTTGHTVPSGLSPQRGRSPWFDDAPSSPRCVRA